MLLARARRDAREVAATLGRLRLLFALNVSLKEEVDSRFILFSFRTPFLSFAVILEVELVAFEPSPLRAAASEINPICTHHNTEEEERVSMNF